MIIALSVPIMVRYLVMAGKDMAISPGGDPPMSRRRRKRQRKQDGSLKG
jgi:hypothetical protein